MFLVYEDAIMPRMTEKELSKMIQSLREEMLKRAKSNYLGLVINLFQGLYVYQQLGINISSYKEVEEMAKGKTWNGEELMAKSHELARQLVRRPSDPFKEPETEMNASVTFVPKDKKMLVLTQVLNNDLEACMNAILRDNGAKRYDPDNESYQKYGPEDGATLAILVDFERDLANVTFSKDLFQVLCVSDATLAYLAAEKKTEMEKFGEFIKAKNMTGELTFDKVYEMCTDAMDFTTRFVEYHAEEIRTLSLEYMPKLNVYKLLNC